MSLAGRRIVVTRAAEQAEELTGLLRDAGAEPVVIPTIRIDAPESWADLEAALGRLPDYRWVVFTSSNGVRAFAARAAAVGVPLEGLDGSRVAAVGASTARALKEVGIDPAFVPSVERSSAMAAELPDVVDQRVLLTRADIANPRLADTLRTRGAARVDDVVAYRTVLTAPTGDALEELRRGVDGITFTSPSTLRGFQAGGGEWRSLLDGVAVVTLGPATTEAVRREGMEVAREAADRSMSALVDALVAALGSRRVADEERGT